MNSQKSNLMRRSLSMLKRLLKPALHKAETKVDFIFLGSEYGGWPAVIDSLSKNSCVYSVGIGGDISFDLGLIDAFGCQVRAFDPTPRCLQWLQSIETPTEFDFHPVGLSDKTKVLRFSAPPVSDHMSYTVGKRDQQTDIVELPVKALDELMADVGDTGRAIDLLKMDIEGSEYDVIPDMVAKNLLPAQLCIEFHHGMFGYTNQQTIEMVELLKKSGYELYFVSEAGREYGFVRQ